MLAQPPCIFSIAAMRREAVSHSSSVARAMIASTTANRAVLASQVRPMSIWEGSYRRAWFESGEIHWSVIRMQFDRAAASAAVVRARGWS